VAVELGRQKAHPCRVAALPRQRARESLADQIIGKRDNRHRGRRILRGTRRQRPAGDDQVGRALDHRRRPFGKRRTAHVEAAGNGRQILPLDETVEAQLVEQALPIGRQQEGEAIGAPRLLRRSAPQRERPRGGAGEQQYEGAAVHSITSSASASSVGDSSRPSTLAAFRLTMNWYLVGCWNGKSPAFSPRIMRST